MGSDLAMELSRTDTGQTVTIYSTIGGCHQRICMGAVTLIRPLPPGGHCSLKDIDDGGNADVSLLHMRMSTEYSTVSPSKRCRCWGCH